MLHAINIFPSPTLSPFLSLFLLRHCSSVTIFAGESYIGGKVRYFSDDSRVIASSVMTIRFKVYRFKGFSVEISGFDFNAVFVLRLSNDSLLVTVSLLRCSSS